jgi:hypothetical protein
MTKLVTLVLTDTDCLSLRLALNAHAMEWGEKASAARKEGNEEDAATCERVRSDYHRLWDLVNVAQEAGGREPDWLARREAEMAILNAVIPDEPIVTTAKLDGRAPGTYFRSEARELRAKFDAYD